MQAYPHHYHARATGSAAGPVDVRGPAPGSLETWPPPEFDGPVGEWSPEALLVAAIADCFVLTFRGIARAARLQWERVEVEVSGTLERLDGVTRFTHFVVAPRLCVAHGEDVARAQGLLEKAERGCLVSNSLKAQFELEPHVLALDHAGSPA